MRVSLATRLALLYIALASASLAVFGSELMVGMAHHLVATQEHTARTISQATARLASPVGSHGQHLSLTDPGLLAAAGNSSAFIQVSRGAYILQASANLGRVRLPLHSPAPTPIRWGSLPLGSLSAPLIHIPGGTAVMTTARVATGRGEDAAVEVAVSMSAVYSSINAVGAGLLRVGLALFVLSALTGIALTFGAFRRMRALAAVIQRINGGEDLQRRVPENGPHDEVKLLAAQFNLMLDGLESSFRRQQLVVAEASHQLRTPLASAIGYAEMLKRWGSRDESLVKEAASAIHDQLQRLNVTLDAILQLGAPRGDREPQMELLNLEAFLPAWSKTCAEPLCLVPGPPVTLWAEPVLLGEALAAIVGNAHQHGRSDRLPVLSWDLSADRSQVVISVRDFGSGLPTDALPSLFLPFRRGQDSLGAGLGLSLAQTIVERQGGCLSAENACPGARFSVSLPVARG